MLGLSEKVDKAGRYGQGSRGYDVNVGCCGPAVNPIGPSHVRPMFVEPTAQKNGPKGEDN